MVHPKDEITFRVSKPSLFCDFSKARFASLVHLSKKAGFSEEPRHPAIYLLDTRWQQMHNAMRVREGTVTITGSHPHSRWSLCAQGHSILSQYQASYPAILDIATYLSLNKLFGMRSPTGVERRYASNSGHWQHSVCMSS